MTFTLTDDWRPDYGSLRHTFDFDPLNHGAKAALKDGFRSKVRAETSQYGFYFAGEVAVSWALYVDEQTRWESDAGADVDNFAKLLDDVICGTDGLLIDDVQVQRLEIAWLPTHGSIGSFELTVRCSSHDVVSRPAGLYEMSDRLWYPISDATAIGHVLHHLDDTTHLVTGVRSLLVDGGATHGEAFNATRMLSPIAQGFHTTRAKASGFETHPYQAWTARLPRPADMPDRDEHVYQSFAAALGNPG